MRTESSDRPPEVDRRDAARQVGHGHAAEARILDHRDRGVARHVDPAVWQGVVAHLGEKLRQGRFEEGLTLALEEVSAVLVEHFPETGDTPAHERNQLPDEPVLR